MLTAVDHYMTIFRAAKALEDVNAITQKESRLVSRALTKLAAMRPLNKTEEAACQMVLDLNKAYFA